ncbi:MAG: hypothetical protein ACREGI_03965 [Candidatus Levyibacteriota bacterium]
MISHDSPLVGQRQAEYAFRFAGDPSRPLAKSLIQKRIDLDVIRPIGGESGRKYSTTDIFYAFIGMADQQVLDEMKLLIRFRPEVAFADVRTGAIAHIRYHQAESILDLLIEAGMTGEEKIVADNEPGFPRVFGDSSQRDTLQKLRDSLAENERGTMFESIVTDGRLLGLADVACILTRQATDVTAMTDTDRILVLRNGLDKGWLYTGINGLSMQIRQPEGEAVPRLEFRLHPATTA